MKDKTSEKANDVAEIQLERQKQEVQKFDWRQDLGRHSAARRAFVEDRTQSEEELQQQGIEVSLCAGCFGERPKCALSVLLGHV